MFYSSILVIINQLIKIVYYKLIKAGIKILGLAKVIYNIVIKNNSILDIIVYN